jgi:D-tyrosyl-tRNA(Tyr) deacylase
MRAVVQRVSRAAVSVAGEQIAQIGSGLLVLLGVQMGDSEQDAQYLADKLAKLRIFEDAQGKMNLSIKDVGGQALLVSQFTLLGDARGQNRPGFTQAEEPERANVLYEYCCERLAVQGVPVHRGRFRSHMALSLINDGPVTLLLDSRKEF